VRHHRKVKKASSSGDPGGVIPILDDGTKTGDRYAQNEWKVEVLKKDLADTGHPIVLALARENCNLSSR
jgi:hypothetical protein